MTIHEAVAILNERRHLGCDVWIAELGDAKSPYDLRTAFEAIAVAEKYVREGRCAVCGWPVVEDAKQGCVPGNCSMRPAPVRYYDQERVNRERNEMARHAELRDGELRIHDPRHFAVLKGL